MKLFVGPTNCWECTIFFQVVLLCLSFGGCNGKGWNAEQILGYYLSSLTKSEETYNENDPPTYVYRRPETSALRPTEPSSTTRLHPWVKLVMEPLHVADLSLKKMEFSTDFNMYVTWEDGRLLTPMDSWGPLIPDVVDIRDKLINPFFTVKLWHPNIRFVNCKGEVAELHTRKYLTQKALYPRIQRISANYTFSLQFFCQYKFLRYPFDEQRCAIKLSFRHGRPIVNWTAEVLLDEVSQVHVPPEYRFISVINSKCPNEYTAEKNLIECIEYVFIFRRIFHQHIMLLFIPSMLIVFLSWISFWLEEAAAPPRVALGLTSLLTLSTQFNSAQKDLPAVADIKAIDIWMFTCMIMVFASLVEFAISNYYYRRKLKSAPVDKLPEPKPKEVKQLKPPMPKYVYSVPEKPKLTVDGFFKDSTSLKRRGPGCPHVTKCCCCCATGNAIDVCSRVLFPTVFLTFNVLFWVYFAT